MRPKKARDRIEEVQADQMIRPLQLRTQLLQRNARRVGGENSSGLHARLGGSIDLALKLERLRHRLDDEIGGAHALAVAIGDKAVERIANLCALLPAPAAQSGRGL